jgi:hypothetical protein
MYNKFVQLSVAMSLIMKTHQQNDSKMMKGIKTQKNTKIGGPKSWFLK